MELLAPYTPTILAALGILALVLVALLIFRGIKSRVRVRQGQRLGVIEYHEVDETRRLLLVRRDDVEHLLMVGGAQDIVVESGIQISQGGHEHFEPVARPPVNLRPAPRTPVFGDRRPSLRPVEPQMMPPRSYEPDEN